MVSREGIFEVSKTTEAKSTWSVDRARVESSACAERARSKRKPTPSPGVSPAVRGRLPLRAAGQVRHLDDREASRRRTAKRTPTGVKPPPLDTGQPTKSRCTCRRCGGGNDPRLSDATARPTGAPSALPSHIPRCGTKGRALLSSFLPEWPSVVWPSQAGVAVVLRMRADEG